MLINNISKKIWLCIIILALAGCGKQPERNNDMAKNKRAAARKAAERKAAKAQEQNVNQTTKNPQAKIITSMGEIVVELYAQEAPISTENFLAYARDGFYNGTIFHRVIKDFMVQCGGMDKNMKEKSNKRGGIKNEANNGLPNEYGTLAMARTAEVDSATSQFFVNLKSNDFLNHGTRDFGYAVFGKVVSGMEIVENIGKVATGNNGHHQDVPQTPITIERVEIIQ